MWQKSVFRKYSSFISSYQDFKELQYVDFTTRFTKNYNLQGFKELQYVDLQLDLQRTITLKVVRCFFQSFKHVLRTVAILS